jgi:opacity protein-like surface antigen
VEVFGGYSLLHAVNGGLNGAALDSALGVASGTSGVNSNFNGWNAEAQYNVKRWFGIVADVSGNYGSPITAASGSGVSGLPSGNSYSFLFGPALSYHARARMTPFVHALFGLNRTSLNASTITGLPVTSPGSTGAVSDSSFAMAFGGGLNYRLSPHAAIRVGQLDYLYTTHDLNSLYGNAFGPGLFSGLAEHENNLRFSTGIVLRF